MTDLVAFLRARLDEDEAHARAAAADGASRIARRDREVGRHDPPYDGARWSRDWDHVFACDVRPEATRKAQVADCGHSAGALTAHVARHDPARVLRDVVAKRAILDEHRQLPMDGCCRCADGVRSTGSATRTEWIVNRVNWPCPTVRHLAAVYADHPDYEEAWRP